LNDVRSMKVALTIVLLCLLPGLLSAQQATDTVQQSTPADAEPVGDKKEKSVASEEAVTREAEASEDPLAEREVISPETPEQEAVRDRDFNIYGNYRLRMRKSDGDFNLADGGSRIGIDGHYQLLRKLQVFGRAELGFNLLNELDFIFDPKNNAPEGDEGNSFFKRLLYFGFEASDLFLTFGKNWSTYYKVAGFTDRFAGTGGSATGTYNAGTDGGATGTGRADQVIQTRLHFGALPQRIGLKPFNLNLQVQQGRPIPQVGDAEYGSAVGLSALYTLRSDVSLGLAYNIAEIDDLDDSKVREAGLDGDAEAMLVGLRQFSDNWYASSVVSRLLNHETTDEGQYFDGWGWEVYGQYQLRDRIWVTGGWNVLRPDSDDTNAGDYRVQYGVIGLRYAPEGFQNMVYANYRLDGGRLADGTPLDDTFTIGIRWNFGEISDWAMAKYRQMSADW
jgi:predicted porin